MSNHLEGEVSPYLQQHVHNPVDWYPWGEEAFNLAKAEEKPIFLSIGYATCHWCHTMERESFSDPKLAQLMNEAFVNIKVDREELPQVDSLYMEFAQALLGGAGGWPLNVILTPDLKPIFAVTYLPPSAKSGQIGMRELILQIQHLWKEGGQEALMAQAEEILDAFREQMKVETGEELPDARYVKELADLYYQMADPIFGGLQGSPKFPMAPHLSFMLRTRDSRALFYVEKTLEMMKRGGIYDHLGGGFARYAVDQEWMIPHFEKMLYDNALLAGLYIEAWQATGNDLFQNVAEETLGYMLRDMQDEQGGFYTAEDADSEGQEGRFYVWAYDEVMEVLGPAEGKLFANFYGIRPEGNYMSGLSVIHEGETVEEFCKAYDFDPVETSERLQEMSRKMWQKREERVHPFKDDKVIVAWNGLAIRAMADAAFALQNTRYYEAASKAASFIRQNLWEEGRLLRRWRKGEAAKDATLEDYAYLISGLLSLFKVDGEAHWLMWAIELANVLTTSYKSENGPFARTDGSDPHLLIHQIDLYDGAEPSGNAVHAENLIRLYQLTRAERYLSEAEDILQVAGPFIIRHPLSASYHSLSLQRFLDKDAPTLVIALNSTQDLRQEIQHALSNRHLPHTVIIWRNDALFDLIPGLSEQEPIDDKTTLYLCRQGRCEEPQNDPRKILQALEGLTA